MAHFRSAVLSMVLASCAPSSAAVEVQLITDYAPGRDFDSVDAVVEGTSASGSSPAALDRSYGRGVRVATLEGLSPGRLRLSVSLSLRGRTVQAQPRFVRVAAGQRSVVTVTITRDCEGVSCPGADSPAAVACLGGLCVDPECSPEHPELCAASCEPACTAAPFACVARVCRPEGACVDETDDALCPRGEVCIADEGCRAPFVGPSSDAGTPDGAPTDAPVCPLPLAGLLGWWPMDTDDVVGTVVRDRSGNGRDGTIVGSPLPAVVSGRVGEALAFDGAPLAHVDLASVPLDSTLGTFTSVALWMRNDDPLADQGVFCVNATALAESPRYCLWLTNREGPRTLCINGGLGECWGVSDASLVGRWVHLVVVFASGRTDGGSLFIDGVPVGMGCQFGTCDQERSTGGPMVLGMNEDVYAWHGLLDDVRVFDRALTRDEVALLFACAP